MSYNKYKWWRRGARKSPLSQNAHLFDKIQNGDFDLSEFFIQAMESREKAGRAYELAYKNYGGREESGRLDAAERASKMHRVRALKLEFEGEIDEIRILNELRSQLQTKFGVDLWDEMMEEEPMSIEELYDYYSQYCIERGIKNN
jgi:hypothetical protein